MPGKIKQLINTERITDLVARLGDRLDTNVVVTPLIDELAMATSGTEYSYAFPAATKRFTIKNRGNGLLQLSYTAGQSGTKWFSIEPGTSYEETEISTAATITLYLQSPRNNQLLEIISWR